LADEAATAQRFYRSYRILHEPPPARVPERHARPRNATSIARCCVVKVADRPRTFARSAWEVRPADPQAPAGIQAARRFLTLTDFLRNAPARA